MRSSVPTTSSFLRALAVFAFSSSVACATGGGGPRDAGSPRDAASQDAASSDAGRADGGTVDAGAPTDAGGADSGPSAMDAATDAATSRDAGRDAGTDAGTDAGVDGGRDAGTTCAPTSERIAIVELMISSVSGSGDRGEWIELRNAGDCTVDLGGLTLVSPASGTGPEVSYTVPAGTIVTAGGRLVLAQSANPSENHGLTFDLAYGASGLVLDNGGDWIELRSGAGTIDRVSWTATTFVRGATRTFPDARPIATNDNQANWCNATTAYSSATGGPFYGTPGGPNGCP